LTSLCVNLKIRLRLVILTVLFIVASFSLGFAAQDKCLECHVEKNTGESVHPAVFMGCRICHIGLDASVYPHKSTSGQPFGLTTGEEKICFGCHKDAKFSQGESLHMPVASGLCTQCHDPHTSKFPHLLRDKNVCFTCHDKDSFVSAKDVHAPVALDMCTSCHDPHSSANHRLLRKVPPDLCFDCHDKKVFTKKDNHRPVSIGMCLSCHEVHQSNYSALKRELIPELCFICHGREEVEAKEIHKSQPKPLNCLMCHSPHDG
jgi:predicted CXXCH cytochrome family protein